MSQIKQAATNVVTVAVLGIVFVNLTIWHQERADRVAAPAHEVTALRTYIRKIDAELIDTRGLAERLSLDLQKSEAELKTCSELIQFKTQQ